MSGGQNREPGRRYPGRILVRLLSRVLAMDYPAPNQPLPPRLSDRPHSEIGISTDLASTATALARRGLPVFPCAPGAKHPLTRRGFRDATVDLGQVQTWWDRHPDANIGVPTGFASGLDVVDVDVHESGTGFAAFEQARAADLVNGWAWLVRTPSGGLHAYFPRLTSSEQRSWQIPSKHIDFRGDGGYIIAPPSRITTTSGKLRTYELITAAQHQPEQVDAVQLRSLLDPPRLTPSPPGSGLLGSRPGKLAEWVASQSEGGRNRGLFWAACRMAEDGHAFDSTSALLGEAARTSGLDDREVLTTIRSAYRTTNRQSPASPAARPPQVAESVSL